MENEEKPNYSTLKEEPVMPTPPPPTFPTPAHPLPKFLPKPIALIVIALIATTLLSGLVFTVYNLGRNSVFKELNPTAPAIPPKDPVIYEATPTLNPTANWKTYIAPGSVYILRYPQDWTYIETENNLKLLPPGGTPVYTNGPAADDPYLQFSILPAVGRGVEPIKTVDLKISGIETVKYYESETKGILKAVSTPNGQFLSIDFQLPQSTSTRSTIDSLYDQILSTFRFE